MLCRSCSLYAHNFNRLCSTSWTKLFESSNLQLTCHTQHFWLCWNAILMHSITFWNVWPTWWMSFHNTACFLELWVPLTNVLTRWNILCIHSPKVSLNNYNRLKFCIAQHTLWLFLQQSHDRMIFSVLCMCKLSVLPFVHNLKSFCGLQRKVQCCQLVTMDYSSCRCYLCMCWLGCGLKWNNVMSSGQSVVLSPNYTEWHLDLISFPSSFYQMQHSSSVQSRNIYYWNPGVLS
jgi:hypothetical protein